MALYGISFGIALLLGFMIGGIGATGVGYKNLFLLVSILLFFMATFSLFLPPIYHPIKEKFSFKKEFEILKIIIISKKILPSYLSIIALNFNLGIITATYSVLLKEASYSDSQIGIIFSILVFISIIIHYPSGLLSDKKGKLKIMSIGLILVSLSFTILTISILIPIPIFGMIIFGIGHGMIFPTSAGIIRNHTEEGIRGIATGTFYAIIVTGIAIGAPISGLIFSFWGTKAMLILGILIPLSTVITLFFLDRKPIIKEGI
ncbi:MAG: MFS transporter, partial [Candidatus Heimdallarchaeota archaeon]